MMKESKEKGFRFKMRELGSRALHGTIIKLVIAIVECKANRENLREKQNRKQ